MKVGFYRVPQIGEVSELKVLEPTEELRLTKVSGRPYHLFVEKNLPWEVQETLIYLGREAVKEMVRRNAEPRGIEISVDEEENVCLNIINE